MQICVQLNRLASEYSSRFGVGQYSNASKDTRSFENFYLTMDKLLKVINQLSNSLLRANGAIFSHLKKYEQDFGREAAGLSAEERTEHHIINQLKVLRKIAHEAQRDHIEDERLERIYVGIARLEVFFSASVREIEAIRKQTEKSMKEAEALLK